MTGGGPQPAPPFLSRGGGSKRPSSKVSFGFARTSALGIPVCGWRSLPEGEVMAAGGLFKFQPSGLSYPKPHFAAWEIFSQAIPSGDSVNPDPRYWKCSRRIPTRTYLCGGWSPSENSKTRL